MSAAAAIPAGITIYNLPPSPPKWDVIGISYVAVCCVWTALVWGGMIFQWFNRRNPLLRVRGVGLTIGSIFFLHCYWVLAQIVYPIGGTMNVVLAYDIQYFFMGIWFPLGIAMFHMSNSRFLYVAEGQRQFAFSDAEAVKKAKAMYRRSRCNGGSTSWLCRLSNLEYTTRLSIYIGIGMVVQTALTILMWFACAKYHPTYGLPGTQIKSDILPMQVIELGRGWEWWPTLAWFFIWTWGVAPYLIWKSWGIRDTLGWRTQTIACCAASLHATPLFLIASYVPAFYPVNAYFAPSEWIHLSILFFEIFAIFVPCGQVVMQWRTERKAQRANARWETASTGAASDLRASSSMNFNLWGGGNNGNAEKGNRGGIEALTPDMGDRLYTMAALDHVLTSNPEPLQEFSALRDFSGENIAFLTATASWKNTAWPANGKALNEEQVRVAFTRALRIYADFISPRDADFPINISSPELRRLEAIFERATRIVIGDPRQRNASPFGDSSSSSGSSQSGHSHSDDVCPFDSGDDNYSTPPTSPQDSVFKDQQVMAKTADITDRIRFTGEIPAGFSVDVFDSVFKHIKSLVLYNTWVKFVNETINNRRASVESERSEDSGVTHNSFPGKVVMKMKQFV